MLTLTQLYNLAASENINLFEGLKLPEGSPLDRDTMINDILMRCGLNYPNFADPYVMKSAIAVWSAKNQYTFEHVAKIYEADYSPIENYDRYEDMNTDRTRGMSDDTESNSTKNENIISNRNTSHTGTDSTTDTNTVSAYDSSTYQPETQTTSDLEHGENIADNGSSNKSTTSNSKTEKDVTENENTKQTNHIRGNIGVMTATAMQEAEYELLGKFNPYSFISGLFENDLTLFVY